MNGDILETRNKLDEREETWTKKSNLEKRNEATQTNLLMSITSNQSGTFFQGCMQFGETEFAVG